MEHMGSHPQPPTASLQIPAFRRHDDPWQASLNSLCTVIISAPQFGVIDKRVAFTSAARWMFILLCRKDRWCSDTTNLSATRTELGIAIRPAQLSAAISWHQVHSTPSWHTIKPSEVRWTACAALQMLLATSPTSQGASWQHPKLDVVLQVGGHRGQGGDSGRATRSLDASSSLLVSAAYQ